MNDKQCKPGAPDTVFPKQVHNLLTAIAVVESLPWT